MLYNRKEWALWAEEKKYIELPKKFNYIIANTLSPTPTLYVAGQRQNKRLAECRIGLYMMMKKLEMKDFSKLKNLRELQDLLGYGSEEMIMLLKEAVEPRGYKSEEIEGLLDMMMIKIISDIPYAENVIESCKEYCPFE